MSEYREPPAPKPVVIVMQGRVTVVDPRKGSLIWSRAVGKPVNRLFVVDDRLFICVPDWVYCFQLDSGQHLGGVALPFEAKAGVVDAGHLILAGDYASLCLGKDGSVIWSVAAELVAPRGRDFETKHVCKDGKGAQLWESDTKRASAHPPGLAAGENVAQPDMIGRH